MRQINVAIIGTGFMSSVHVDALRRVGVNIAGILGSTPAKSRVAAERMEISRAYENYQQVLNDPSIHAVHVNTPNTLHFEQASAALQAGKHVMCEKPLAMNRTQSASLVEIAKNHPRQVSAVNYNNRFYPLCHQAREMVLTGEVGRIFHVTGSVAQDWLLRDTDYNWRVLTEQVGPLRALADIGSHWIDLIHFITGLKIEAVLADYTTVHPIRRRPHGEVETFSGKPAAIDSTEPIPIATDDYGSVLVRFTNGARANMFVSQVSPGRKYRVAFEIAGQDKTVAWNSEECERLWIGRRELANQSLIRDPSLMGHLARGVSNYPGGHDEGYPDSFKQCFKSFYQYIAAEDFSAPKSFATFEDGHRDNLLCDAFVLSMRRGGWVTLAEMETAQPQSQGGGR